MKCVCVCVCVCGQVGGVSFDCLLYTVSISNLGYYSFGFIKKTVQVKSTL